MDELRVLAETDGFFTRTDALRAGYDDRSIRRTLKKRVWLRIRAGSYTFPDLWPSHEQERQRIRGRCVMRKLGASVALSHTSAAVQHDMRLWRTDLNTIHVTRLDGGSGRTEAGVHHHEGLTQRGDLTEVDGMSAMRPARAALEAASLAPTEAGLVILDSALHLRLCTRDELSTRHAMMENWPGMQRLQITVRMADEGGQSVGETRTRYLCHTQGLPAPETQWEVRDATGRVVGISDFAWPEHQLLGEFDGRVKYGRLLRDDEEPGDAVFREKRREDILRESTGWRMVRLIWSDLSVPMHTAARIRQMLRAAA
ncbi:MAG: type IV toxin-antitoxin system AbiEi family antitoxin domain-containing protein [Actinomycetota bacterium]|nr:type IV toxin-antitoxin system AbiEi family antitoxin domain-containing protein [Actinomycetota bacterium]